MKFKMTGVSQMQRRLKQVADDVVEQTDDALRVEGEALLREAQSRVPIDTGELRDSGRVVVDHEGKIRRVQIVFEAEHALVVHENLQAHHPVGEAKFLERTLDEAEPMMAKRLGEHIEKKLR